MNNNCNCKIITFETSLFHNIYGNTPRNRRIWEKRGIKKIKCNTCITKHK